MTRFYPNRVRTERILKLGLPIMAGSSSYVILGLADMVFVGQYGSAALGAVGFGSFISSIFMSFFWGLSIAVQATVSRLKGAGHHDDLALYLNAAIFLVLVAAPIPSLVLFYYTPEIYSLMNSDPEVLGHGVGYLQWMWLSATFFGINMAFGGFWNATDRSTYFMRVVLFTTLINIPLNYIFIFGFAIIPSFDVEGAGLGSLIAAGLGSGYNFLLGLKHARENGFLNSRPRGRELKVVLNLAIPGGSQHVFDNLALTLMYRVVGMVGTVELASYSVLMNLISFVGLPAWGLGTAGATLIGQALGANDKEDATQWAWDVIKVGCTLMFILGMPFWLVPGLILSAFIHDPETLAMATTPCRILGAMIVITGIGYMLASMLNGAGDVKRVMYVNLLTQYLVLLPVGYLAGPYFGFGLLGIWCVHQFVFRAGQTAIFSVMWTRGRWARSVF